MTTPETERPPPEAEWVHIPEPPAEHRSEPGGGDDGERGRPVGQWVAAGGSVAALGGVGLFQAFGPVGLAAGAVTAAGGAAVYGYHRVRSRNRSGFKMSRTRTRRTTSRMGSVGKGGPKLGRGRGPKLGKGPKLGGGKGPKLGKGGGPKLGRGGGKLLGGKGAKLGGGKSGRLLGGKGAKLGGGRGSKLGGKLGRKATSSLGSVGKSGGKLLGRGGKSGLGLGKRGGKVLGSKGKAGVGRWSKSTGAGAGALGSKFGRGAKKAGGKLGAAALRTKTGLRTSKGFKAAKAAMRSTLPGKGRWKNMRNAARGAMTSSRNPFARWATGIGAGAVAAFALLHGKWRKRRQKAEAAEAARRINEDVNDHSTGAPMPPIPDPIHHAASGRRVYTEGKFTMGQSPLTMAAGEFQVAAGRYTPQDMHEARDAIREIPDIPRYLAQGLQTFTKRMQDEYPIHPAVVEQLGEMYVALGRMATMAEQIPATFERVHEAEIRRRETPRRGEEKWDVGR